jgi:hypothetical protein
MAQPEAVTPISLNPRIGKNSVRKKKVQFCGRNREARPLRSPDRQRRQS